MVMDIIMTRLGDNHWMDVDNIGPIPNEDGTFRYGPKMTAVYANGQTLFKLVLVMDAIVFLIWALMLAWVGTQLLSGDQQIIPVLINMVVLGVITGFCIALTIHAVRSERLMIVIANGHIDDQPIMGLHDDWPVFESSDHHSGG